MAGLPPGIGNAQQAMQATAFIRQEPWYTQWIASLGKRPDANGNVPLNDAQRDQLRDMAVQHGIGLNHTFDGIDENGQIVEEHHKLRNTLVGAAIGGAALTGFGAAGIGPLAGAFGGASAGAAGAGAAASTLPSTVIGSGFIPAIAGGTGMGAGVGAGVGAGAAAGAAATLPSTVIGSGYIPAVTGSTGMGASSGMGFLNTIKQGFDLYNKGSDAVDAVRGGPSAASGLATTAGSIESQRAAALVKQAQLQQAQDQLAQNRALLALRAPGMEAGNAVRGDVLANSKDVSFSGLPSYIHVPQMSGGLRPSMLSQNSRDLGANMSRNALMHNMKGDDVPDLTPLPTSTGYDTALQGVTTGAGFLNALGGLGKRAPTGGGASNASSGGGSYWGAGASGYPGDGNSPINPMIPKPLDVGDLDQSVGGTGGLDPAILEWWKQQSQGADNNG